MTIFRDSKTQHFSVKEKLLPFISRIYKAIMLLISPFPFFYFLLAEFPEGFKKHYLVRNWVNWTATHHYSLPSFACCIRKSEFKHKLKKLNLNEISWQNKILLSFLIFLIIQKLKFELYKIKLR